MWRTLAPYLRHHRTASKRVLRRVGHTNVLSYSILSGISSAGDLAALWETLVDLFPPNDDPPPRRGAHVIGPEESARLLRDQVLMALTDRADDEAIGAVLDLQRRGVGGVDLRWRLGRMFDAHHRATWRPPSEAEVWATLRGEPWRTVYLSSRFNHPCREQAKAALLKHVGVKVTEGEPRDEPPARAIGDDIRASNLVVQLWSWSTGLGVGPSGVSYVATEEVLAGALKRAVIIGVLTDGDACPAELDDHLTTLRGRHVTLSARDPMELVNAVVAKAIETLG